MEEISLYNGAVAKMPQQQFAVVPSLSRVQGFGKEVDAAIKKGLEVAEDEAELHDFGVRQEVAAKRADLELERDLEWERRSALANGAEGSFWTAEGARNEDAIAEFNSKYEDKDAQIERPYWLPRNAARDAEASQQANLAANRQVQLMAVREEARRRRAAFDTNMQLAAAKNNYEMGNALLADAVRSGMLTPAEAELKRLKLSEQRMRGLGRAARGGRGQAVTVGGKPYHGVSAALAMQAARDDWKPSSEEFSKQEATEPAEGGAEPTETGAITLDKVGEVELHEAGETGAITLDNMRGEPEERESEAGPMVLDESLADYPEEAAPALPEGLSITLSGGYDPLSMDDAARVPLDAMRALQDDFSGTLRINQALGVDGRMHFDADQNAPLTVRAAAAQAEERGAIETETARGVVGEITLDTVRHNPAATVAQIMTQFDGAGIFEALGEGDAEVGKQRTQAIVQEWHARGTTGYTNVSAKNIERLVEAAVNAPTFGKGQEWRAMEKLNPNVSGSYDKPDREDEPDARKRWDALFAVYKRHREEFSVEKGKVLEPLTKYGDVDKDEFEPVAQEFYRWYMGKKHDALKRDAMSAGRAYYTAAVSEELAKNVAVGDDGKPVAQFSNEMGIVKGVLAKPVPDMGVEAAARQAEERERLNEQLTAASRARAQASYRQLAEFKQEHTKRGKEAERRKKAEERAAEKAEKAAEKREEARRQQELYKKRVMPRTARWEWSSSDAAPGMPPTCTVPREEYGRLMGELGLEDEHVPYMVCNGKKIMVVGYNQSGKVRLNGPAVQAVYGRPKKGQSWQLQGELGYHYEFKKRK